MQTFLDEIAEQLLSDTSGDPGKVKLIFPNRRAGLFLRRALAAKIQQPVWAPEIYSLEDFLFQYTDLQLADKLTLVYEMYSVYRKLNVEAETLEKFFFWGEVLVSDFEDIDQYLVEPEHLFRSVQTQKELDEAFAYLGENERKVIQSFWKSFVPKASRDQGYFLKTWQMLLPVYREYRQNLSEKKLAYKGMVYREIAERCQEDRLEVGDGVFWFAGFNALTAAEEAILKYFVREAGARLFWDLDKYYLNSEQQESGQFFRQYQKDTLLGKSFPAELPDNFASSKAMEAIGVSLEMGQAKYVGQQLGELAAKNGWIPEETVVVMPAEHFLFPVLHSLPESIAQVNVTMGYPLKDTPLFGLLDAILDLRKNARLRQGGRAWSHRDVLAILRHPYVFSTVPAEALGWITAIERDNLIFLQSDEFSGSGPLLKTIFHSSEDSLSHLLSILALLFETLKGNELEQEYLLQFHEQLLRLKNLLNPSETSEIGLFQKLFRKVAQSVRIPFSGEPLKGLQLMGVLETRNLDFKRVIVLGMNEGYWPAETSSQSFIPYNLRKGFGLPTFDQQDAFYSYLFYRLLQRAEQVTFLYNTSNETNLKGEMSRLLYQLRYETDHQISFRSLSSDVAIALAREISIEKTAAVMDVLNEYLAGVAHSLAGDQQPVADRRLTPSALNTYLDCRLRFFYRYVAKLYEPDQVQDEIDPAVFGNILHYTLEFLYGDFMKEKKAQLIEKQDFEQLKKGVPEALQKAFNAHYQLGEGKDFRAEGRNLIAQAIARRLTFEILRNDELYAPFEIAGLELADLTLDLPISGSRKVKLKGIIDRVDKKDGLLRVMDYKSGSDNKVFFGVSSLFDREHPKRNKAAMQTFYYGMLYLHSNPVPEDTEVMAGLYNSRDLFSENFQVELELKSEEQRGRGELVRDIRPFLGEFSEGLGQLLEEIFDPSTAFDQTDDQKKCRNCPYHSICHRE